MAEKSIESKNSKGDADLRLAALDTMLLWEKQELKLADAQQKVLAKMKGLPADRRAFYVRLVEGCVEKQILLDYVIDAYSKVPVKKMKPAIRNILRLAVFEIREMDGIPERASVSEALRLAERKKFGQLKGFLNGILRTMLREPEKAALPEKTAMTEKDVLQENAALPGKTATPENHMLPEKTMTPKENATSGKAVLPDQGGNLKYISVRYSLPEHLAALWLREYGLPRTEELCLAQEKRNSICVHIRQTENDPEKTLASMAAEGVKLRPCKELKNAWFMENVENLTKLMAFQKGEIYIQDQSSQRAVYAAELKPGDCILDVCAAPGGKSLLAADLLEGTGQVLSRDISPEKTALIDENIRRMGYRNIKTEVWDARVKDSESTGVYDVVFVDAPCSGYGVIGKKPDIKYSASPEKEESLCALQREILTASAAYVKPGGMLVYSTCTLNPTENAGNAKWFGEQFDFELMKQEELLPGEDYEGDGFFIAKFRRKS